MTTEHEKGVMSIGMRKQAEEVLKGKTTNPKKLASGDVQSLVHELQVHQIELEMQNEELRRAQKELEDAYNRYSDLYDFAPIGYFTFDKKGLIFEVNLTGAKKLGVERAYLIKKPFSLYIHGNKDAFYSHLRKVFNTEKQTTCELRLVDMDGNIFDALLESMPMRDSDGNLLVRAAISDITERKRLQENLNKERQDFKLIIDSSPIIIFYKDIEGKFIRVNRTFADALKMPEEDVVGKTVFDLYSARIAQDMTNDDREVLTSGRPKLNIVEQYESASGIRWVQTDKIPICDKNGIPVGLIGFTLDITERKWAELEYKAVLHTSMDGFYIVDTEGHILDVNDSYCNLIGYSRDELLNMSLRDIEAAETEEMVTERIRRIIEVGWDRFETRHRCKDGSIIEIEASVNYMEAGGGKFFVSMRDITERKRDEDALKESETRFRSVVESAADAVILADNTGTIISWNRSAEKIFLYSEKEVLSKPLTILMPERFRDAHLASLEYVTSTGESNVIGKTVELNGLRKDGTEFPLELSLATWMTEKGTFYSGIIHDITERKQADDQIKASLKEKEILLSEIHHRVKNNMQIISSLLRLQSITIKDKKYVEMFRDSQNRINSMALIHEKLYRSKDFAGIELNDYIKNLANNLFHSCGVAGRIELNLNIENVSLGIDLAIPCGLIINELMTNSLKHAFPGDRNGEIKVSAHLNDEDMIELIFSDNGVGIPSNIDFRNTQSFGLHLVTILVQDQLSGKIDLDRSRGTEFWIKFKDLK